MVSEPHLRLRELIGDRQEEAVDSPRHSDNVPEATLGLLGAPWLLEAAHVLPETETKLLGAEQLPGSRQG
jgi:hypothetical protein